MENKIKLNTGLASIILVASLFAGWQTLLLVTVLMFLLCDVEDRVKQVATSVITFYVGYYIVLVGWDIICAVFNAILGAITGLMQTINTYLDYSDVIKYEKVVAPINYIWGIVKNVVSILFDLVKLGFVVGVLTGRPASQNPLSAKINDFVNKAINYVNGNIGANMSVQPQPAPQPMPQQAPQPVQPVQPVQPQPAPQPMPQQPVQPQQNNNQNM